MLVVGGVLLALVTARPAGDRAGLDGRAENAEIRLGLPDELEALVLGDFLGDDRRDAVHDVELARLQHVEPRRVLLDRDEHHLNGSHNSGVIAVGVVAPLMPLDQANAGNPARLSNLAGELR